MSQVRLADIIDRHESELLKDWMQRQQESLASRRDLVSDAEIRTDSRNLLAALREAVASGDNSDISRSEWAKVRDLLTDLSRRRAIQGFSPTETAMFVFSLKQPLFDHLTVTAGTGTPEVAQQLWHTTTMLDKLGLYN